MAPKIPNNPQPPAPTADVETGHVRFCQHPQHLRRRSPARLRRAVPAQGARPAVRTAAGNLDATSRLEARLGVPRGSGRLARRSLQHHNLTACRTNRPSRSHERPADARQRARCEHRAHRYGPAHRPSIRTGGADHHSRRRRALSIHPRSAQPRHRTSLAGAGIHFPWYPHHDGSRVGRLVRFGVRPGVNHQLRQARAIRGAAGLLRRRARPGIAIKHGHHRTCHRTRGRRRDQFQDGRPHRPGRERRPCCDHVDPGVAACRIETPRIGEPPAESARRRRGFDGASTHGRLPPAAQREHHVPGRGRAPYRLQRRGRDHRPADYRSYLVPLGASRAHAPARKTRRVRAAVHHRRPDRRRGLGHGSGPARDHVHIRDRQQHVARRLASAQVQQRAAHPRSVAAR